ARLELAGCLTVTELPDSDQLVGMTGDASFLPPGKPESSPYSLVTAEMLYSYFSRAKLISRRHALSELMPLLYRLSKIVDRDATPRFVQEIISISLQMGSIDAADRF